MQKTVTYYCAHSLTLLLLLLVTQVASGQQITLSEGSATVDKGDSIRLLENRAKQLINDLKTTDTTIPKVTNLHDTLRSVLTIGEAKDSPTKAYTVKKIYSEKYLAQVFDSLSKNLNWEQYKTLAENPQAGYEDLMRAINKKFSYFPDQSKYQHDAKKLSALAGEEPGKQFPSLSEQLTKSLSSNEFLDFKAPELPNDLKPLQGVQLKPERLNVLDSLRKINLKEQGLRLKELTIDTLTRANIFEKKPRFMDKTYFEGIIGLLSGSEKITLFQVSPSLAYRFTNTFSTGAGLNVMLREDSRKIHVQTGARIFSKQEFYKNRLYLQVEDMINFTGDALLSENTKTTTRHSLLTGGGCLLPISKTLSINISALYRITGETTTASPWVMRIGLSTKTKKGHGEK